MRCEGLRSAAWRFGPLSESRLVQLHQLGGALPKVPLSTRVQRRLRRISATDALEEPPGRAFERRRRGEIGQVLGGAVWRPGYDARQNPDRARRFPHELGADQSRVV